MIVTTTFGARIHNALRAAYTHHYRRAKAMSRQQRYQLRRRARGLCMLCGGTVKAISKAGLCFHHLFARRTTQGIARGCAPWHPGGPGRPPIEARGTR